MACIRKLYFDLINDFDPYYDESEIHNISNSDMLYNLKEMKNNYTIDDLKDNELLSIYNRINTLIDLFQALKIN